MPKKKKPLPKKRPSKGPFGSRDKFDYPEVYRDFDCFRYDECLMFACKEKWKVFTCKGCTLANELTEVISNDNDFAAVIDLVEHINAARKKC